MECYLSEIFSSFQGEGLYLGKRQLFIRFAGCNLKCTYCDTKRAREIKKFASIEKTPFKRDFFRERNPLKLEKILEFIKNLNLSVHKSISITGGEPLLQTEFLLNFLPFLKKKKLEIYLETNGTLPEKLIKILNFVDIIAMDIKLPSNLEGEIFFEKHRKFLEIASSTKSVFVKIVVTQKNNKEEFKKAVEIIKRVDRNVPLIIQPLLERKYGSPASFEKILDFYKISQRFLKDVRVIPQIHKILKIK